jgi:hypothetical protein
VIPGVFVWLKSSHAHWTASFQLAHDLGGMEFSPVTVLMGMKVTRRRRSSMDWPPP